MGAIRGIDCKIYLNTGTHGTPTWVEWLCARDSTFSLTFEEADATCRGSGGYRQSAITLSSIEVTGSAIKEKDDATFLLMEAAAVAKDVIDILVMDGTRLLDESDGWRLQAQFFSWVENQAFEDIVTIDWTLKPARDSNAPVQFTGTTPP